MGIIFVLLPISLLLAFFALIAYLWSVKSGQFEDLDTPSRRILFDEDGFSDTKNIKFKDEPKS